MSAAKQGAVAFQIGGKYNWKNQPERLVYLGRNWSGNGFWHQFAKVEAPAVVWCEVLDDQLPSFEETKEDLMTHPPIKAPFELPQTEAGIEVVARWIEEGGPGVNLESTRKLMAATVRALSHPAAQAGALQAVSDERAAFEAEIRKDAGDLTTFGSGANLHYCNSAVNNAWGGWKARAALAATQPSASCKQDDTKRMDWLSEQLVDTIYLDDGRIVDVGTGRIGARDVRVSPHDLRAAIDAAMREAGEAPPAEVSLSQPIAAPEDRQGAAPSLRSEIAYMAAYDLDELDGMSKDRLLLRARDLIGRARHALTTMDAAPGAAIAARERVEPSDEDMVNAAYRLYRYRQGTDSGIAFNCGARWMRGVLASKGGA